MLLMRARFAVVVLACTLLPLPRQQATAQRTGDGRAGIPPVHQDTTRGRNRDGLFVDRAMVGLLANAAVLAPTALLYSTTKSEMVLFTGVLTQLVITPFAVARVGRDTDCGTLGRMAMAFGGALAGLGGSILFAEERYQNEHPHTHDDRPIMRPAGVTALAIGIPLGAAAAIYDCQ
jgi:hypothetical protein